MALAQRVICTTSCRPGDEIMLIREVSFHFEPTEKGEGDEWARNHETNQAWLPGRSTDRSWLSGS